jgi:hypothetical protein
MGTQTTWEYFGLPPELDGRDVVAATAGRNGQRAVTAAPRRRWRKRDRQPGERDRAAAWLRVAMAALGPLADRRGGEFQAQYVLVREVKTTAGEVIAAMQAAIPDAGALVFAALGIAMALCGRRALRARAGNVLCVGISLAMNAMASAPTPRALAVWIMPAALYALASDTLIMVIRAHALARQQDLAERLAGRRRGHPAGDRRRFLPVAPAAGPGPVVDPDWIQDLGCRGMPCRPGPYRRAQGAASCRADSGGAARRSAAHVGQHGLPVLHRRGPRQRWPLRRVWRD